ncbi:ACT domain-containing protein [Dethiobacter alkaliphilus]|uniref:ACT domain-containing protein n=1 Tax=Dethiobacter alkaliphilus TaxID=427926 RepID=UPI002226F078|nr:ACT domain-containing protein [Dethiobacter alkaliphilus]MCW3488708.1 ACT domain-containing protein [Dethiobacter alkaliphilus]
MKVKQISVFLENKSGRLAEVTRALGDNEINIRALSIADTTDFGILRLIVNKPEEANQVLRDAGFMVSETEVIAVDVPDRPGGLADVLDTLGKVNVNIEYLYAFIGQTSQDALVVFRVEDCDAAMKALKEKNIRVLDGSEVYAL